MIYNIISTNLCGGNIIVEMRFKMRKVGFYTGMWIIKTMDQTIYTMPNKDPGH